MSGTDLQPLSQGAQGEAYNRLSQTPGVNPDLAGPAQPPPPDMPLLDVPQVWPQDPVEQQRALKHVEVNLRTLRDKQDYELDQMLVPAFQQQAQQTQQELQAQMLVNPPRTPQMVDAFKGAIGQLQPFLRPEQTQDLSSQLNRSWVLRDDRQKFEGALNDTISSEYGQYLPETERKVIPASARRQTDGGPAQPQYLFKNPKTGEWEPDEPDWMGVLNPMAEGTVRGRLMDRLKKLADQQEYAEYGPDENATPAEKEDYRAHSGGMIRDIELAQKYPDISKRPSRETYRAMLSDAIQGTVMRRLKGGTETEKAADFASDVVSTASFLVPTGVAEKLSISAVKAAGLAVKGGEELTKMGKLLGHVVGPSAAMAAWGLARPLGTPEQLDVDSSENPERKQAKEIAYRWIRATQEGLMTPLYLLAGKIGGKPDSSLVRKLLGSLGVAATAPAVGEAGNIAADQVAKVIGRKDTESAAAEVRDVYASQGAYGAITRFFQADTSNERFAALKQYAKSITPGAVVFGALAMMHHLGGNGGFDTRAAAVNAMEKAAGEVAANPTLSNDTKQKVIEQVRQMGDDLMPDRADDDRRAANERLQAKLGETKANAATTAQSMLDRFFGDIPGDTAGQKLASLMQQRRDAVRSGEGRNWSWDDPRYVSMRNRAHALQELMKAVKSDDPSDNFRRAHDFIAAHEAGLTEAPAPMSKEELGTEAIRTEADVQERTPELVAKVEKAQEDVPPKVVAQDDAAGTQLVRKATGETEVRPTPETPREELPAAEPAVGDVITTKKRGKGEITKINTHDDGSKSANVRLESGQDIRVPLPKPEEKPLPGWVRQSMQEQGKNPARMFNEIDASRPGFQEVVAADPVVQRMTPELRERALKGDLSADEYRQAVGKANAPPTVANADPLTPKVREHIQGGGKASARGIQKEFGIGFIRANKILKALQGEGAVSGVGEGPRGSRIGGEKLAQRREAERAVQTALEPVQRVLKAAEELRSGETEERSAAMDQAMRDLEDSMATADPKMNRKLALSQLASQLGRMEGGPRTEEQVRVFLPGIGKRGGELVAGMLAVQREVREREHANVFPGGDPIQYHEQLLQRDYDTYVAEQKNSGNKTKTKEQWLQFREEQLRRQARAAVEKPDEGLMPRTEQYVAERLKAGDAPADVQAEAARREYAEEEQDPQFTAEGAKVRLQRRQEWANETIDTLLANLRGNTDVNGLELATDLGDLYSWLNSKDSKLAAITDEGKAIVNKARALEVALRNGLIDRPDGGFYLLGSSFAGHAAIAKVVSKTYQLTSKGIRSLVDLLMKAMGPTREGKASPASRILEVIRNTPLQGDPAARQRAFAKTMQPSGAREDMVLKAPIFSDMISKMDAFGEHDLVMAFQRAVHQKAVALEQARRISQWLPEGTPEEDQHAFIKAMENYHLIERPPQSEEARLALEDRINEAEDAWARVQKMGPKVIEGFHAMREKFREYNSIAWPYLPEIMEGHRIYRDLGELQGVWREHIGGLQEHLADLEDMRNAIPKRSGDPVDAKNRKLMASKISTARKAIKAGERGLKDAMARQQKIGTALDDHHSRWLKRDSFFPAIPNQNLLHAVLREEAVERGMNPDEVDLPGGTEKLLLQRRQDRNAKAAPSDFNLRLITGHWLKKNHALEGQGKRDFNVVRSYYHYASEVLSTIEMAKWWKENQDRIQGRRMPVSFEQLHHVNNDRMFWDPVSTRGPSVLPKKVRVLGTVYEWRNKEGRAFHASDANELREFAKGRGDENAEIRRMLVMSPHRESFTDLAKGMEPLAGIQPAPGLHLSSGVTVPRDSELHKLSYMRGRLWSYTEGKFAKIRRVGGETGKAGEVDSARYRQYVEQVVHQSLGDRTGGFVRTALDEFNRYVASVQLGNLNPAPAVRNAVQNVWSMTMHSNMRQALTTMHWAPRFSHAIDRAIREGAFEDMARGRAIGDPGVVYPKLAEAVRYTDEQLAGMAPAQRKEAEFFNEAAGALSRSPFVGSMVMEALGDVQKGLRPGDLENPKKPPGPDNPLRKLTGRGQAKDYLPFFGRKPFVLFSTGAKLAQIHTYLTSYVLQRKAGISPKEAQGIAERYTLAEHGITNRAMNSELVNKNWYRPMTALAGWMLHRSLRNLRYYGTHGGYTEARAAGSGIASSALRHTGTSLGRFLYSSMYLVAAQQMGQMLGNDVTNTFGTTVDRIPFVGGWGSYQLRRLMSVLHLDRDVTEPGSPAPDWRRQFGDYLNQSEWLPSILTNALTNEHGEFNLGTFESGIPLDIFFGTWSPYTVETFEDAVDWLTSTATGDEKSARKAGNRFLMSVIGGSYQRVMRDVLFSSPDPTDPDRIARYEPGTGILLERAKRLTLGRYAMSWFGPDLESGYNWTVRSIVDAQRNKFEINTRKTARDEIQNTIHEALDAEANPEMANHLWDKALEGFQKYKADSGRVWAAGESRELLKSLITGAEEDRSMASIERDIAHALTADEKIGKLVEVMTSPTTKMTESQFTLVFKAMNLRSALQHANPKISERFFDALDESSKRWDAEAAKAKK
jgi:hypothetical protein